jgi:hypothetical protein
MKAVLEGASYKLSITDPASQASFSSFIEAGRYRDSSSLQRSYSSGGTSVTYTELIAIIAWELAESQPLLASLEIRSWERFMGMLETAGIYEAEVGQVSFRSPKDRRFFIADIPVDITRDRFYGLSQTLP